MDNTAMTLLGVIAAPVTVLFGPVAAYNLVLRAGFTCRRWPCSRGPAPGALVAGGVGAGLLYGFSPFMVGQGLSHEFLVFAPIPPLVLGVLAEVLSRRGGGHGGPGWCSGCCSAPSS